MSKALTRTDFNLSLIHIYRIFHIGIQPFVFQCDIQQLHILLVLLICQCTFHQFEAVSYTHLDVYKRQSLPSMKTLGVTTLIPDSGITRYKIITEEWEIYDKKRCV